MASSILFELLPEFDDGHSVTTAICEKIHAERKSGKESGEIVNDQGVTIGKWEVF